MRIAVVYQYRCTCGYIDHKTDTIEAGTHIRLMIEPASSCPQCHQLLQAQVTIEYRAQSERQTEGLAEIANMCQELGIYD